VPHESGLRQLYANQGLIAETHAKCGAVGMTSVKPFGILVEAEGRGGKNRVIGTSGDRNPKRSKPTPFWDGVGYPGRGRGRRQRA
jgi:hypothetical protein